MLSASFPMRTRPGCESGCLACGSQRSQSQSASVSGPVSTVIVTSRGLCSTAADSSMARASARVWPGGR